MLPNWLGILHSITQTKVKKYEKWLCTHDSLFQSGILQTSLSPCFGIRLSKVALCTCSVLSSLLNHPSSRHRIQDFLSSALYNATPSPPPSSPFSPPALQESGCHSMFPVTTLLIPSSPVSPNLPLSIHLQHEPVSALQQFNWNWSWLHLVKFRLTGKWWEGLVYMSVWDELIWLQKELVA